MAADALGGFSDRAVAARAARLDVPDLDDPSRIRAGAGLYDVHCAMCHRTPGQEPTALQRGMQPPPPVLPKMEGMDPAEVFWTIKHGMKLTGMPAWGIGLDDGAIWDLTALVERLPSLDAAGYRDLVASSPPPPPEHLGPPSRQAAEQEAGMEHGEMSLRERVEMRTASGTSWQPETTPMTAFHLETGPVHWMFHGNAFALYDATSGSRGDAGLYSINWAMAHATLSDDDSELGARAMVSLEPWTVGGAGYPLLGQTGETWLGAPLVDHQHPHDLFMELALLGRQTLGDTFGAELYVAPVGEPALGPTAFMHRASAISDPLSPIGHHWEDSTHLSYGVVTAGIFDEWVQLEGSWFNGREPDEQRSDLDLRTPDSGAGRLTLSVLPMLTAQVSAGWLASPEALEPGVPTTRVTASATIDHDGRGNGNWAATAGWGRNIHGGVGSDALLFETDLAVGPEEAYGRAEYVVKSAEDLVVRTLPPGASEPLTSVSLGNVVTVPAGGLRAGIGVCGNLLVVPRALGATYGARAPVGGLVYLQLRPAEGAMEP